MNDLHEIWHNNANWAPESDERVKFRIFQRTAAILKNRKSVISLYYHLTDRHEFWHGDAYWHIDPIKISNVPRISCLALFYFFVVLELGLYDMLLHMNSR